MPAHAGLMPRLLRHDSLSPCPKPIPSAALNRHKPYNPLKVPGPGLILPDLLRIDKNAGCALCILLSLRIEVQGHRVNDPKIGDTGLMIWTKVRSE